MVKHLHHMEVLESQLFLDYGDYLDGANKDQ